MSAALTFSDGNGWVMEYSNSIFVQFFSNPAALFFASVLFTLASFRLARRLLKKFSAGYVYVLAAAFFNGTVAVIAELVVDNPLPYVMMLLVPAVIVAEFRFISKDASWSYLFVLLAFLLNFSIIHEIVVAALGLVSLHDSWYLGFFYYRVFVFTLSLLASSAILCAINVFMPFKELYSFIHCMEKSMTLFFYMLFSVVVVIASSYVMQSIAVDWHIPREIRIPVYTDLILKDILILTCSYIILLLQFYFERISRQKDILDGELRREKAFRAGMHSKAFASCIFNMTRRRLDEGYEYFEKEIRDGFKEDFSRTFQRVIVGCLHPEDRKMLSRKRIVSVVSNALLKGESRRIIRFRMSGESMKGVWKMPPDTFSGREAEWIWFEANVVFVRDEASNNIILYVNIENVDDEVSREKKLITAARLDAVTGLYNRATLEETVRSYLSGEGACGAMFMIDMDNFKTVNDSLGHQAGDGLLMETASIIKSVFRTGDIIGRMGGDEFCVFAAGLFSEELIAERAESLIKSAVRRHRAKGKTFYTTLSVGIAICPGDGEDYETLYKNSDSALYAAKSSGKNTFRFYSAPGKSR